MTGRISEESNEARNGIQKETKRILKSMVSQEQRVQKMAQRSQGNLKCDVIEGRLEIAERCKGKKRVPYRPRSGRRETQEVMSVSGAVREVRGERFVVLASGNLLPERWLDIYEWFLGGRAPKNWLDQFSKTAPSNFSELDNVCEMNSKLV